MKIKSSEWNKLKAAVSLSCKYCLINIKSQRLIYYIYTVKPNAQIPYFEKTILYLFTFTNPLFSSPRQAI